MTPESWLPRFFFPIRVRFADTDLQGHVFFSNYFTYMDEAFMAYIDELSFSWKTLGEMGRQIYYVDSGCQFRGPSFFGDRLNVHARISQIGNSSLTADMTVVRESDQAIVADGYIKGVLVDTRTATSTRLSDAFRAAIANYQEK